MGIHAKKQGNNFESIFEQACRRRGVIATRFPDGCRTVGKGQLLRVKTPWDWILSFAGKCAFIDTKTCAGRFPYSHIETHQVIEMSRHEENGLIAGYAIWSRGEDQVFFIPASALLKPALNGDRGSAGADHAKAKLLGSVVSIDGFDPVKLFL